MYQKKLFIQNFCLMLLGGGNKSDTAQSERGIPPGYPPPWAIISGFDPEAPGAIREPEPKVPVQRLPPGRVVGAIDSYGGGRPLHWRPRRDLLPPKWFELCEFSDSYGRGTNLAPPERLETKDSANLNTKVGYFPFVC